MSWCRACKAEIRFAKTESGATMPLDAKPDPEGPIVLLGHPGVVHVLNDEEKAATARDGRFRYRFTSHFKTCPKADQFRRKRPTHAA